MIKASYILLFVGLLVGFISCKTSSKYRHTYMEKAYQSYKDTFPDATISLLDDSIKVIFPNNILFNSNESQILEQFMLRLDRFAVIFNLYPRTNMLITGHSDSTGEDQLNSKLSLDRANNVKSQLIKRNVQAQRIFTWGLGQKSPLASNDTEAGRAKNRRVEFVILFNSK